ncbi:helix-turn-helix domain-containing protein [Hymenobacter sp. HD11105]
MDNQNLLILSSPDTVRELLCNLLTELLSAAPAAPDAAALELLTMVETCREFGVSKTTLTEWRKAGVVPFVRLERRVYFEGARCWKPAALIPSTHG